MKVKINKTLIYSFLIVEDLSIDEFCCEIDIDRSFFDNILNGKVSLQTLFKMAKFMKVEVDDLIFDKGF